MLQMKLNREKQPLCHVLKRLIFVIHCDGMIIGAGVHRLVQVLQPLHPNTTVRTTLQVYRDRCRDVCWEEQL